MTALRHHPHGETLMSHAAGALDPALSVVLSVIFSFARDAGCISALWMTLAGCFWSSSKRRKTKIF